jgi:hypothetical protein
MAIKRLLCYVFCVSTLFIMHCQADTFERRPIPLPPSPQALQEFSGPSRIQSNTPNTDKKRATTAPASK